MADIGSPNIAAWREWVAECPPSVQKVCERIVPWKLYRMKSTGHRVTVYSYDENMDGTITLKVDVTGTYNLVAFERRVFGVAPESIEECDLPSPDELLGSADIPIEDVAAIMGRK